MLRIHALRPGRPLVFRKTFWVYTFEAVMKAINAAINSRPPEDRTTFFLTKMSGIGGKLFLRFVNPRSRDDILNRFFRDIHPYGKTIHALWESATER